MDTTQNVDLLEKPGLFIFGNQGVGLFAKKESDLPPVKTIKVLLLGDAGVGKSVFIKNHVTGNFEKNYIPTEHITNYNLSFNTTKGKINFEVFDFPGSEQFHHLHDYPHYSNSHAAMLMFDVASKKSYENIAIWHQNIMEILKESLPIILISNKADRREREVMPKDITFHERKKHMEWIEISAKSNYNFEKPFLYLARRFLNDPHLGFVSDMTLEFQQRFANATKEELAQYEQELLEASWVPKE